MDFNSTEFNCMISLSCLNSVELNLQGTTTNCVISSCTLSCTLDVCLMLIMYSKHLGIGYYRCFFNLNVKSEVHNIAILNDILFTF